jgi:SAM-dependent methyltransferase
MPPVAPENPNEQPEPNRRGAEHEKLLGASQHLWYRPERLTREELGGDLSCKVAYNGGAHLTFDVLDLSRFGFAYRCAPAHAPLPGTELEMIQVMHRGQVVWTGRGVVARAESTPTHRIGVRITSGGLDLETLIVRESVAEQRLVAALAEQEEARMLPAAWRAEVSALQQLFQVIMEAADGASAMVERKGWWRDQEACRAACASLYARWGPVYRAQCMKLERMSRAFDAKRMQIAHRYAQRALSAYLLPDPSYRRAYEKPLGYAGDYRLMELIQNPELEGDSLYGRFLHYAAQRFTLAEAVRQRGAVAVEAVRAVLKQPRPVRIVSLACGPAIELQRVFADAPERAHPVELLLLDQDEAALRASQGALLDVINRRRDSALITVSSLRIAVRQIVLPKPGQEQELTRSVLRDLDLVYSMGLFDYLQRPVAKRITSSLWAMLRPGGRLLIGNLRRVPDSSWMLEYSAEWNLVYREAPEMRDLAAGLRPAPARARVRRDKTGRCLFLDAQRGTSSR